MMWFKHSTGFGFAMVNTLGCLLAYLGLLAIGSVDSKLLLLFGWVLCIALFAYNMFASRDMVLVYRNFLLGGYVLFAMPQLALSPGTYISPTMVEFQTMDNAAIVSLISVVSLGASGVAWWLVMSRPLRISAKREIPDDRALAKWLFVIGTIFCLIHSAVSKVVLFGDFNYGTAESYSADAQFLSINTWGFAGLCCFLNVWIMEFGKGHARPIRWTLPGLTIIVIIYCFVLRGFRSEMVTFSVALIVLFWLLREAGRLKAKLALSLAASVCVLGAFTLTLGAIRGSSGTLNVGSAALKALDPTQKSYDVTTGVDIAAYNWLPNVGSGALVMCAVGLREEGAYEYMLGETVIARLRNTLPRIINPLRVDDLALIYDRRFGVTSTGGMPELAEGYINFGWFGAILLSGAISLIIFLFYRRALERNDLSSWAIFGAILMSIIYSNLYGIGHVYKAALTGVLLNLAMIYISRAIISKR
jgi:hypothetical protein